MCSLSSVSTQQIEARPVQTNKKIMEINTQSVHTRFCKESIIGCAKTQSDIKAATAQNPKLHIQERGPAGENLKNKKCTRLRSGQIVMIDGLIHGPGKRE